MESLLIHVRDNGGGWSNYVRFLDNGTPVTDIQLSFTNDFYVDYQNDSDGDELVTCVISNRNINL